MNSKTQRHSIAQIQNPPWQYLEFASITSLQSFELNRLNHAANLMKQIQILLQQYLDDTAAASTARLFMQHRGNQPGASVQPSCIAPTSRVALPLQVVRPRLA